MSVKGMTVEGMTVEGMTVEGMSSRRDDTSKGDMSVTLGFRFPWGRYHATPWGRHVNEGVPEWPPSPWRVIRALYATWQNRLPQLDESLVLTVLDKLTGSPDFHLPPHVDFHTRHWMPGIDHRRGSPGQVTLTLDPFVVVPTESEVLIRWEADATEAERRCLSTLTAHLTYLGRAESVCIARLVDDGTSPTEGWLRPGDDAPVGVVGLLAPTGPIAVAGLTQRPEALRAKGHIYPPGSVRIDYPRPQPVRPIRAYPETTMESVTAARFAIAGSVLPSQKSAVSVGHILRQAAMSKFGKHSADMSSTLAGKRTVDEPLSGQHRHAHYLSFTTAPDPRLRTVVIWAPDGMNLEEVAAVAAIRRLTPAKLTDSGITACRLALESFGPTAEVVPELVGPARNWRSFTPFAPTHHSRERDPESFVASELTRELHYRGLPEPTTVSLIKDNWLSYRRRRPTRHGTADPAQRAFGARLTFAQPLSGPLVLGALSHFGLGLFLPEQ